MSKFLKFFLLPLVLLAGIGLASLYYLKPRLGDAIKDVLNSGIDARINYKSTDISFFRSFPKVSLSFIEPEVIAKNSPDTLAAAERFSVAFDLLSLLGGELSVRSFRIDSPRITVLKDRAGKSNWDIFPETGFSGKEKDSSGFVLSLDDFRITDASIAFYDSTNGNALRIRGLDHELKGRMSGSSSTLRTGNTADSLTVMIGKVPLLTDARVTFDAVIGADPQRKKFTFRKNRLGINDLDIAFEGTVSLLEDAANADLNFNAEKLDLKRLLSLSPAFYAGGYDKLEASGEVSLAGHVKGLARNGQLPAFRIAVDVSGGTFGYEGVPVRARNVVFRGTVENPGGKADSTTIAVPDIGMTINGRPFSARFALATPVSDPAIDAAFEGSLALSDLQKLYPRKGLVMAGDIRSNVAVNGALSAFTSGRGEAYGSIVGKNISVVSDAFSPALTVPSMQINLAPRYASLVSFRARAGKSDVFAEGRLENYMAYLFGKGKLGGALTVRSDLLRLDEFRNLEKEQAPFFVPPDIALLANLSCKRLRFGDIDFSDMKGTIRLRDETLECENVTATSLGGRVAITGRYATPGGKPDARFRLNATGVDIAESYRSVAMLRTAAPVAEYARGSVSADLDMTTGLDKTFRPVPETFSGEGRLAATELVVEGFPPVKKLAMLIDVSLLDTMRIPGTSIGFRVDNGLVTARPFSFSINDLQVRASGVTGFDRSLDWKVNLKIPKKYIGNRGVATMTALLKKLPLPAGGISLPDTVLVDASLKGSLTDPEIGLDLRKTADRIALRLKDSLKQKITGEIRERLPLGGRGDSAAADSGTILDRLKKSAAEKISGSDTTVLRNTAGKKEHMPSDTLVDSVSADTSSGVKNGIRKLIEGIFSTPARNAPAGGGDGPE
ncbi:hypothetical protein CHL67_06585 [Prosthecochloris sp. GSB1]|uniref:AsmA-like C-terminal region-containing protein n=1 Tax=Prosthecochloris sp. GSB1 TaxID=281093 RepID=UPI000B8C7A2F|nr:AsmA-like C-terminal region-containing protein [Prosthecochloris sp. GSB1]ASQ90635.1 hypothetical protein CHL67_06585 [Prosthecochloris sp. GSB1]